MNGPSHRVFAAATWLAVAPALPVAPWQVAVGAVVAGATGNGRLSPDVDHPNFEVSRWVPGGHRGWTHFWAIPLLMFGAGLSAGDQGWWLLAVAVAWASHLVGDWICGAIPIWPGKRGQWQRAGLHLKTGGLTEVWLLRPAAAVAVVAFGFMDLFGGPSVVIRALR